MGKNRMCMTALLTTFLLLSLAACGQNSKIDSHGIVYVPEEVKFSSPLTRKRTTHSPRCPAGAGPKSSRCPRCRHVPSATASRPRRGGDSRRWTRTRRERLLLLPGRRRALRLEAGRRGGGAGDELGGVRRGPHLYGRIRLSSQRTGRFSLRQRISGILPAVRAVVMRRTACSQSPGP